MYLTLQTLFNDPNIIKAVIDRTVALRLDTIYWQRYLDFEQTQSRIFKVYLGTQMGVTAGSVIDRNSNKPLRERKSLGSGYGETAYLGDRYQLDNDRLDQLRELINKFNGQSTALGQQSAINDIVNYIVDDMRQVYFAPHKRMDLVVGDLRSKGVAQVKASDNPKNNPNGVSLIDIELPFYTLTPTSTDTQHFLKYLMDKVVALRTQFGTFSHMEMSRSTFIKNIVGSGDFGDYYKQSFAARNITEIPVASGLMSSEVASTVLQGIGLPAIVINEDMVQLEDGTFAPCFADDRISLFPSMKIGKMRWHEPYEITDPVPTKTYTRAEGGMFISTQRTEEGRFTEYGCEWIPDIQSPNKIVNINLETANA